ncbi:hypothetical protein LCGC14_2597940, partial [marine sediment metagenome]
MEKLLENDDLISGGYLEIKELKEKITWLSEENAKLYTQLDNDALKRATNTDVLQKFFQVMIAYSCNEISDEIP